MGLGPRTTDHLTSVHSYQGKGIAATLKSRGIDLAAIKEKALTSDKKIADMEVKEGQAETVHIRSLDDIVGTEKIVLNKFKDQLKPEEWQSKEAFERWAKNKIEDIIDFEKHPEYLAKGEYAKFNVAREEGIHKWAEYLKTKESGVSEDVFAQLIFLNGLVSEMKPDNAFTPPAISHGAFEEAYNQMLEGNSSVSLTKAYAEASRKEAMRRFGQPVISSDGIEGTWVRIEKVEKNHPEYNSRIAMIQALSEGSSWCLRFENAHSYFSYGDIWFFVDKTGKSQAAINFDSPTNIREIEKRYSQDRTVPIPYVQVIKEWKEAHGFTGMENEIKAALDAKPEFDKQKIQFAEWLKKGDVKAIFGSMGIKTDEMPDGTYLIDKYTPFVKDKPYTLADLDINEDKLMQNVSGIGGNMVLEGSALTSAPNLKKVGNGIFFSDNKINDLRGLEEVVKRKIHWQK